MMNRKPLLTARFMDEEYKYFNTRELRTYINTRSL